MACTTGKNMAKETKEIDHSEQSADIQSGTEPQTSKILLGLALQPLQMPLFVDPDNALGADEHFVTKTFGTVKPLMQAVADAAVAKVHLDGQFTVHLKQTATSALLSLQLVIAKRGHFTTQDEGARMELAAALATRLSDAMTRVASESALIRGGEELHDLVLERVAFIKLKGIPLTFSFGVFTEPIEDTSTLAMTMLPDPVPEVRQAPASPVAPALHPAIGKDDRVHGTGNAAAQPLELNAWILEQSVQHAPGERAVRATALQRQIEPRRGPAQALPPTCKSSGARHALYGCGQLPARDRGRDVVQ